MSFFIPEKFIGPKSEILLRPALVRQYKNAEDICPVNSKTLEPSDNKRRLMFKQWRQLFIYYLHGIYDIFSLLLRF